MNHQLWIMNQTESLLTFLLWAQIPSFLSAPDNLLNILEVEKKIHFWKTEGSREPVLHLEELWCPVMPNICLTEVSRTLNHYQFHGHYSVSGPDLWPPSGGGGGRGVVIGPHGSVRYHIKKRLDGPTNTTTTAWGAHRLPRESSGSSVMCSDGTGETAGFQQARDHTELLPLLIINIISVSFSVPPSRSPSLLHTPPFPLPVLVHLACWTPSYNPCAFHPIAHTCSAVYRQCKEEQTAAALKGKASEP